jgi:hypothetical protein
MPATWRAQALQALANLGTALEASGSGAPRRRARRTPTSPTSMPNRRAGAAAVGRPPGSGRLSAGGDAARRRAAGATRAAHRARGHRSQVRVLSHPTAEQRAVLGRPLLVVAHARLVVRGEDLAHALRRRMLDDCRRGPPHLRPRPQDRQDRGLLRLGGPPSPGRPWSTGCRGGSDWPDRDFVVAVGSG